MLRWVAIFLVIAIIAAIFGFTGIAPTEVQSISKGVFFVFLVILVLTLLFGELIFRDND